jgi:glycosyltransferase involved in cell wall biosynthesis
VIFLTEHARNAVLNAIGPLHGRLAMVPHGVNRRFFVAPRLQREPDQFTVERPCRLLYVSIVDAYKHQWCVAEAVARLRTEGLHVVLDLVGPPGSSSQLLAETLRRIDPGQKFVYVRGAIRYEELHSLYENADIGVFASSCENMPNILLEEMAAGLPIACSNYGPMPAMLGNAGVYFDPTRTVEIEQAIRRLIESSQLRTQLAEAAFERAGRYSWETCATETFRFLSQVATSGAVSSS